ncbi:MAG TPA: phosphoglucosamine mutase [Acidimicrobiales bacterium]|nr:phosphoglucosamine mutase [Acidimicrobiales bacterium]
MSLRFGTDGVRGLANAALHPEFVTALGRAAARTLVAEDSDNKICAIGRDTRRSGPMLTAALAAGLTAEGVDVVDLGVVPTPAVAYWAQTHGHPGSVISASHNPYPDNGVKFFAAGGRKLTDATQEAIETHLEALLERTVGELHPEPLTGAAVGTACEDPTGRTAYVTHLVDDVLDGRRLDGLRVVADAANGAASTVVADVLAGLGATVTVRHADPDGTNINDGCGSTHPEDLAATVVAKRAQVGIALDGDADRVVAVDETGRIVDGDALLALFALDLADQGRLTGSAIVATVMSNLGLRRALEPHGIDVVECAVGDRAVLATLEARSLVLGGEQSGHLIFTDHATTGDGLLAGVLLLDVLARTGRPLSELAAVVDPMPQVLRNVRLAGKVPDLVERMAADIAAAEAKLAEQGRVLVRLSGTEPLARVLVEATDAALADEVAGELVAAAQRTVAT